MFDISIFSIVLDIASTSLILYALYRFFRGTQTATIVKGIAIVVIVYVIASVAELSTIKWIFLKFFDNAPIIIAVIFHQELRYFFSNLGRNHQETESSLSFAQQLAKAMQSMSDTSTGALILVERNMKLQDLLYTGVVLNATSSVELILSIFNKTSPLHDGAILIKNEKILAAKVFLPVVFNQGVSGTRHGSAMSITKDRDCIAFVVSEETGEMSYAKDGILTPIPNLLLEEVIHEVIK